MGDWNRDAMGFLVRCARDYGDVVPIRLGPSRMLVLSHPDLVQEVLVAQHTNFDKGESHRLTRSLLGNSLLSSEGDFWRRQRRLAQPAFHHQRIAAYAETMVAYAQRLLGEWRDGEERDVHHEMMRLTLEIVAKTLFDADVAGEAAAFGATLTRALERFDGRTPTFVLMLPTAVPLPANLRFRRTLATLDQLVFDIVRQRRASGEERGDLLSMLLQARDDAGQPMTEQQLRDETITLLFAGHETTALALTWAWYLLGQHPTVQADLEREVDTVLGNRPPTAADVPRLPFAHNVMREALRLYPPASAVVRQAKEACVIGGYAIPAKTNVLMSQWVIHRDPRWWERPNEFDPHRWGTSNSAPPLEQRLPPFAYFPFGGGPRVCIGSGFATLEMVLLLATIAQRYRLPLVPGQTVVPRVALTLRPHPGVRVRLERRARPAA